jgi:hypothetical protein
MQNPPTPTALLEAEGKVADWESQGYVAVRLTGDPCCIEVVRAGEETSDEMYPFRENGQLLQATLVVVAHHQPVVEPEASAEEAPE